MPNIPHMTDGLRLLISKDKRGMNLVTGLWVGCWNLHLDLEPHLLREAAAIWLRGLNSSSFDLPLKSHPPLARGGAGAVGLLPRDSPAGDLSGAQSRISAADAEGSPAHGSTRLCPARPEHG